MCVGVRCIGIGCTGIRCVGVWVCGCVGVRWVCELGMGDVLCLAVAMV